MPVVSPPGAFEFADSLFVVLVSRFQFGQAWSEIGRLGERALDCHKSGGRGKALVFVKFRE